MTVTHNLSRPRNYIQQLMRKLSSVMSTSVCACMQPTAPRSNLLISCHLPFHPEFQKLRPNLCNTVVGLDWRPAQVVPIIAARQSELELRRRCKRLPPCWIRFVICMTDGAKNLSRCVSPNEVKLGQKLHTASTLRSVMSRKSKAV